MAQTNLFSYFKKVDGNKPAVKVEPKKEKVGENDENKENKVQAVKKVEQKVEQKKVEKNLKMDVDLYDNDEDDDIVKSKNVILNLLQSTKK